MPPADPNSSLDEFQRQVRTSLDQYLHLEQVLQSAGEPVATAKAVAEDAAFRLGALWEVFQGRWHVAAISREPSVFASTMQIALDKEIKNEWTRKTIDVISPGALRVPPRPRLAQIEMMLDHEGRNITFRDVEA